MNKTPFFEIFPELEGAALPRPFGSAFVTSAAVDSAKTGIDIVAEFPAPPSPEDIAAAETELCASLGFRRVTLSPLCVGISDTIVTVTDGTPPGAEKTACDLRASVAPAKKAAPAAKKAATPAKKASSSGRKAAQPKILLGRAPTGSITAMSDIDVNLGNVTVEGRVFSVNSRSVKNGAAWVLSFDITDNTGSLRISKFMRGDDARRTAESVKPGMYLTVSGRLFLDRYENNDTVLDPVNIAVSEARERRSDNAPVKRVELHLHTKMSAMDAVTDTAEVIARAAEWGHPALAITDHGVVQSFPDAAHAPDGVKIIYGVEGYFINDLDSRPAIFGELRDLDEEFVVFDLETTGLDSYADKITEIAAVTIRGGEIISEFHTYANPGIHIPREITELTGITDEDVRGAPDQVEAVRAFLDYAGARPLAAHNASFDLGFVYEVCFTNGIPFDSACLDTLPLARALFPELYNHKLPTVSSALRLPLFDHHHALADAKTTGLITIAFIKMLKERGLYTAEAVNKFVYDAPSKQRRRVNHIIILTKTQAGLKNLYRIITDSHLEHFQRNPIIPKSLLTKYRDGLIIGSACEAGEIFAAVERGSRFERHRLAKFYDYLEIQPVSNNLFMLRGAKPRARDVEQLRGFNRAIVELGRETGKMVCATGDVHFLDPEDEIFRKILLNTKGYESALEDLPLYFRTTEEMLEEFAYLGESDCYDVVVTNTRAVSDMIEKISPLPPPKKLFAPKIENSAEDLKNLVYSRLRELYGETPPELVTSRVETELSDILGRGYDVIYITAQRLVRDSGEHGYLVGSRGSVGSSVVAYLAGITEVNALPAHYRCPKCRHSDFESGAGFGCGADMPDKACPVCSESYEKHGFDIPFETFLGFGGDKVPDIDLNFSGEYQAEAHKFTTELFGAEHVFRAGTIGTVKEKTAFGYVKKYLETIDKTVTRAEENRLAQGCVGVKRTTGQHPGGLVVIPQGMDITDFCPAQRPADDADSDIITTHFEYHCMEDNLLKLDELGHDDPTMIRMLEEMTDVSALDIPLGDPETLKIFSSPSPLGAPEGDAIIGKTGTIGISEFGTGFTRQMLVDTLPDKVDTLVRLSGYSHGTDVWAGNARDIIMNKVADISETIGCRDDITLYLVSKGMEARRAYKISEAVRKGRGVEGGDSAEMTRLGVPEWYIESCKKIKYLFPKAHAAAYVMMALRIAWFKVHRPIEFYSAYFYRRSQKGNFDAKIMTRGDSVALNKIREIKAVPDRDKKDKDEDMLTTLEACHEFYARGFSFLDVDLYESDAVKFAVVGETSLRPPLIAVAGLGETAARDIAERRRGRTFISIEDFSLECSKVSTAHISAMSELGAFGSLPATSQYSMFG